ncbi:histone deacetylase family protein [Chloroflexota bacterium]
MKRLCIIFQEKVAEHDFGPGHPVKSKERLYGYLDRLRELGLSDLPQVSLIDSAREVSDEDILTVHESSLLELIKSLSKEGGILDGDTPLPQGTYERAKLQVGGFLDGAQAVLEDKFDRSVQVPAFGGHHAMRRHGYTTFGFCYLHEQGIVVRYLQRQKYIEKALILDTDCHHGNGTQDIFYNDPTVLTISLHQDPHTIYPGVMGFADETGEGRGKGFNVNVPLPPRTGCQSYMKALSETFPPLASEFQPDIILAVLGGDTHFQEPLTNFGLGLDCYQEIANVVVSTANDLCRGKVLSTVSGGRNLISGPFIACESTASLLEYGPLQQVDPYGEPSNEPSGIEQEVERTLIEVKRNLSPYWRCF